MNSLRFQFKLIASTLPFGSHSGTDCSVHSMLFLFQKGDFCTHSCAKSNLLQILIPASVFSFKNVYVYVDVYVEDVEEVKDVYVEA